MTTIKSTYDGFTYSHNDPSFHAHIVTGRSEPYPADLAIVQAYLKEFPEKARAYIDVGGHVGTTLLPYSRLYAACIAYEPNVDNYAFLLHNMEANGVAGTCTAKNVGCSNASTNGKTLKHGSNTGCYFFEERADGAERVCRLDDDPDVAAVHVDFIKVDVEGMELAVLQGARETILRCRPLIALECNDLCTTLFGTPPSASIAFLTSLGALQYRKGDANTYFYFPSRVVRTFWTGVNAMSDVRKGCLEKLRVATGVHVVLYTPETIRHLELPDAPFHPAFEHLSAVHRADFLRTYCMHFYGGGYSDIKIPTRTWTDAFATIETDDDAWIVGYQEIAGGVAYGPMEDMWKHIIGNGAYICKPRTPLTQDWYDNMMRLLDEKLPELKLNPAPDARACAETSKTGYPIEWNEMLGRIFHRVIWPHIAHVRNTLPPPVLEGYQ
jgi:FkbM family methyltransferase